MDYGKLSKRIGANIKEIRIKKGLSQKALADMCEFEKSNMNRIESGTENITIKTLIIIANCLEIDVIDLLK